MMHTTKIWVYETCDFKELSTKNKDIALENVEEEIRKEIPELMSIGKRYLEKVAGRYKFLKNGKIYKKKERFEK